MARNMKGRRRTGGDREVSLGQTWRLVKRVADQTAGGTADGKEAGREEIAGYRFCKIPR